MPVRRWGYILLICFGLFVGTTTTQAQQSRTVYWSRWDVTIDDVDPAENRFTVTETYALDFTGTFRFGSRVLPNDRVTGYGDVEILQDGRPMRAGCRDQAGTFCVTDGQDDFSIVYNFFEPITNGSENFTIRYVVEGALRVYDGGDQLWWKAIPNEHFGFTIGESTILVNLPDALAPREGVDPVETYGVPTSVEVSGSRVIAQANEPLTGDQELEIRVQYPHTETALKAPWQSSFDARRAFEENVQPILSVGLIGLSLLIGLGGPLWLYNKWTIAGRDPKTGPVPTYLTEPPSALPPAVVGTLLDEKADVRDVLSTLIDLAHRGYLVIEEGQTEGFFGIGKTSTFTFKKTDKPTDDLLAYERRMMSNIFKGDQTEKSLSDLQNRFYTVIPQIQSELYGELVANQFFNKSPDSTRTQWSGVGVVLLIIGVLGVFFSAPILDFSPAFFCLPLAVGLVGIMMAIIGQHMPARTQTGAEETAKWNAFREYLQNIERYTDLTQATDQFDRYLPYAVAFGLDRAWIGRFSKVANTPLPPWYYPTAMGRPYHRGYGYGQGMGGGLGGGGSANPLPGELARANDGPLSLDQMSSQMGAGLSSLSTNLSTMLNTAASTMTSRPSSSGGGGGGSFSGGGGGGGGGSGGGSSGFG